MVRLARLLAVLLAALSVAAPVTAHALDKAGLIKAMETKYKGVTTIKATVVQTTRSELLGNETITTEMQLKRPAKMRWQLGPDKLFVIDGQKMWIYTAEDKQVIEYDDVATSKASAETMLANLDKLEEKFLVSLIVSDATQHVIDLAPKATDGGFKKVRLSLGPDFLIRSVIITDTFDNVTEMVFKTVQLNVPMDDALFTFSVPSGVDVIKAN